MVILVVFRDENAALFYLDTVSYISGDKVSYAYGGPYRIVGNISPSEIGGITAQDFLWFYSDLTAIKYYKNSKSGLVNALCGLDL